jgi:hypothetical protein
MLPILSHLNELMGLKLCCRIEPRKEENPTYEYEDNSVSRGEKKGSTNSNIVKIILAVVGCVTTGGTLYFAISCYISYSTKHGWDWGFGARIRPGRNYVPDNSL